MVQPHNDQSRFYEDFHNCVTEELIEQPDNSIESFSIFVPATDGSMAFFDVLSMAGSAMPRSS